MQRSDKLIEQLMSAGVIDKFCDKIKAKSLIQEFMKEVHNEAVLQTVMAQNRPHFTEPKFND